MKKITQNKLIASLRLNSPDAKPRKGFKAALGSKLINEDGKKTSLLTQIFSQKKYFIPLTVFVLLLTAIPFALNFSQNASLRTTSTKNINSLTLSPDSKSNEDITSKDSYDSIGKEIGDRGSYNSIIRVPSAAQLTGREVDDNVQYKEYLEYKNKSRFSNLYTDFNIRYLITVVDKNGKPVFGKQIKIMPDAGVELNIRTYADGKVYFFPYASSRITHAKSQGIDLQFADRYTIEIDGQTFIRSAQELEWNLKLNTEQNFDKTDLEVAFILDTTGSMSDQINQLKATIKSISDQANQMNNVKNIRWGLVLYRDKGDEYVTKKFDFTSDINQFQSNLAQAQANGGGDYPEDANRALEDAVENLSWESTSVKMSFLITDAPPHMDYGQQYDYSNASARAVEKGIKIYTLASSGLDNSEGEFIYRKLALTTNAKYLFITNASGDTSYHVDDQQFTVKKIDKLIVDLIKGETEKLNR